MARLYLDEDMANFGTPLRDAGHEVLVAGERGARQSDPWHLQRASTERCILLTFNASDFRYLHRLWTSLRLFHVMSTDHAGIVTATAQLEPSVWLPAIDALLTTEEELTGRMLVWHPSKQEWHEDKWRSEE